MRTPIVLFPLLILSVCVIALVSAYSAQYIFNLKPCILCIYQRIPYAAAGLMSIIALIFARYPKAVVIILSLIAIVFLGEAILAFFHMGVEQHWWENIENCNSAFPIGLSIEQLHERLMTMNLARCDDVGWAVFGISITVYNVVLAIVMAVFSAIGVRYAYQG